MNRYKIEGGAELHGCVDVQGSKNAALPILAATVINRGKSLIHNCPCLSDVENTLHILKLLGCNVVRRGHDVEIDSAGFCSCDIPLSVMSKSRGSVIFAGAMLARCGRVYIAGSGGCCIGTRPINIHLKAFEAMGINVIRRRDAVVCSGEKIIPATIRLEFPSVGATENIMIAASAAKGCTVIENAAREPEICNLADYLRSVGVGVSGDGSATVRISGTDCLCPGEVTVMPDRIVAATYIAAVASAGGSICIKGVNPSDISSVIALFRRMGLSIGVLRDTLWVSKNQPLKNLSEITTAPYPGIPTDCQPLIVAVMCGSEGVGVVSERIFENRFGHCLRLTKLGADISIRGRCAVINGKPKLNAADVDACDLRCGAALVVALLGAEGTGYVSEICYIERGYENLCGELQKLGAHIERI